MNNLKQNTFSVCKAWLDMLDQLGADFGRAFQDGFVAGKHPAPLLLLIPYPRGSNQARLWHLGYLVGEYAGKDGDK